MKNKLLLFLVFWITVFSGHGEEIDKSYECLKDVVQKMTNSSCPLITPEVESDRDDYARLYTACLKGHYLIRGCNESEWVHACTRRVANIPNTASSDSLRGFQDTDPMWKYCNKDVIDADYECLEKVIGTMTKDSCPELENADKLDLKTLGSLTTSCLKNQYINNGCDEDQWVRVCNRRADRFNVAANGGQEVVDMWRSTCDENPAYNCFENAIKDINDESCAEVVYSKSQNDTVEHIIRHKTACYKRFYINAECDIAKWKKVCNIASFTFKPSERENGNIMRKYCST